MKTRKTWLALILLGLSIVSVSAFVYESAQQSVDQTIRDIATFNLKDSTLGDIEEGETRIYTKANVGSLGAAINITTTKEGVYLYLDSNLDGDDLAASYSSYNVTVKFIAIADETSTHHFGETACIMTMDSPYSSSVTLDKAGLWSFDFEIAMTAKSVTSDQGTSLTIIATAESST
jgi:hypothetical protein